MNFIAVIIDIITFCCVFYIFSIKVDRYSFLCRALHFFFKQATLLRQSQATLILEHLSEWIQQQYVVVPKSLIGKALAYSIERSDKLYLYTRDGMLKIIRSS
ncbi:MAG: transposase, partial [Flavisolibacter sp.]|nr:transposase [Flavisolibacter sp.]